MSLDDEGWIDLPPQRGKRLDPRLATVTVAYRKSGNRSSYSIAVNFSAALARQLGWAKTQRVKVRHHPAMNRLTVTPTSDPAGSRSMTNTNRTYVLLVSMNLGFEIKKPAQAVRHEVIEGNGVLVHLPAWAQPPSFAAAKQAAESVRR